MTKYDPLLGVPFGHYYILHIKAFGDFEVEQEEQILFTSPDRQELIDHCNNMGWRYQGEWCDYYVEQRTK